jgi:hypothetical protein
VKESSLRGEMSNKKKKGRRKKGRKSNQEKEKDMKMEKM